MKKILSVAAILAVFSTTSAFAKTEGSYLELDLLRSAAKNNYKFSNGTKSDKFKDNSTNFGVSYKYAFNFNNLFVAPGVFFDNLSNSAKDSDGDKVNLNHRYGVKFDIGYDVTDKAAVYFTNGFASTAYKVDWGNSDLGVKSGSKVGYFFGGGVLYHVASNVTVNFEYNVQSLNKLHTPYDNITGAKAETKVSVAKVGVAYHF